MSDNQNQKSNKQQEKESKEKVGETVTRAGLDYATAGEWEQVRNKPIIGKTAKKAERQGGKSFSRSPGGKKLGKVARKMDDSGAVDYATKGLDAFGGAMSGPSSSPAKGNDSSPKNGGENIEGNSSSAIDNSDNEETTKNTGSDDEITGKLKGLFGKKKLKIKIALISVISSLVFTMIFIVVLISPLITLGIIDINGTGGGTGLGYATNTYLNQVSAKCEDIIVDNVSVKLEDYVAGVVSAEAYLDENIEALKAQAIAARTFAIVYTNYCQTSIGNSSSVQNYTSNYDERAIEATKATEGLVLTYNSELFLSQYDSYYTGGDYECDSNGNCSVTYNKLPNNETHDVIVNSNHKYQVAGGHGYGMSQVGSYVLADQGHDFNYILSYFYSPGVEINSLYNTSGYTNGLSAGVDGFTRRTGMPVQGNSHDNEFYFSSNNASYAGGYVGQCTWYAYGRANEILNAAGSDLKWTHAPHAKYWLQYNIDSGAKAFSYSTDVNEPKVGAIIVWSSNNFGHVGVVEAVNADGTIDYSEANINSVRSSSNPYGFRYQSNIPYTGTGLGTVSNIFSGYSFVGYIYMVE